ncbi:MAG TPA: alpha/beta hydrolase fold domain-containing protein [Bryobacteraceae bacterium]|nr:alpha/beta hydrolase fold domain-containing protein [Bryobacteraceae bacterium]
MSRLRLVLALFCTLPLLAVHRKEVVFKSTPQGDLKITLFYPADWKPSDRRAAVVFFFGGGFVRGTPSQFYSKAAYLASRGMVAASAEYRVSSRHKTTVLESYKDCRSAIRWLRKNAVEHGVDWKRIAAGGGSAGASCAMALTADGPFDEATDDRSVSAEPSLLLLYNPAVDIGMLGAVPPEWSPKNQLKPGLPPMLMFFGTDDLHYRNAQPYFQKARQMGNSVTLYYARNQKHGFFNDNPNGDYSWHAATLYLSDTYLAARAHITGKPTIAQPTGSRAVLFNEADPLPAPSPWRPAPAGVRIEKDIVYARLGARELRLDLYLPEKAGGAPRPLIIWIHGGAWRAGSKENAPVAKLVAHGFAGASIGYRYTQEAPFPANVQDAKAAIRWLRANASTYHLDPNRIGLWGSSAGGYLASFLGTTGDDPEWEPAHGLAGSSSRVQAVVDWFGPTRLSRMSHYPSRMDHDSPDSPENQLIGALVQQNLELADRANPARYASKDDPPFLIQHGDADSLVPLEQSEILKTALAAAGAKVELEVLPGAGHGGSDFQTPANLERVRRFFESTLK